MLIYEKDNMLIINFDDTISENPDIVIKKEDGVVDILVSGDSIVNDDVPLS